MAALHMKHMVMHAGGKRDTRGPDTFWRKGTFSQEVQCLGCTSREAHGSADENSGTRGPYTFRREGALYLTFDILSKFSGGRG